MTDTYRVVPASVRHIRPLAKRLRAAASATLAGFGFDPRAALHRAFKQAIYCRTAMIDDRPVAMWGVTGTLIGETGYVWLVMSDDIGLMPLTIAKGAKAELSQIMSRYREIATTVLPDDDAAIRFAIFLGFHDRHDADHEGLRRRDVEREIRNNPRLRIPVGDQYVIALGYHPEGR